MPSSRETRAELERRSDEELIRLTRRRPDSPAEALEVLFERYHPRVATWCLRVCNSPEDAAELAQEVFLRVQTRLDTFRMESRFSTWLYTVTRRLAINRGLAERRRRDVLGGEPPSQVPDDRAVPEERAMSAEIGARLRHAMRRDLTPLEARILYLHFVDGLTLPRITELMALENRSGAKAYVVSGRRKLERRFGHWLRAQEGRER